MSSQGFIFNVINKMRGNKKSRQHEHFSKEIFNDPVEKSKTTYDFPPAQPGTLQKIRIKLQQYNLNMDVKIWLYTSLLLGFIVTMFLIIF